MASPVAPQRPVGTNALDCQSPWTPPAAEIAIQQLAGPSLDSRRVVNILLVMTHSSLGIRTVCFGLIAALAFATAVPAWAQEPSSEYVDPTIVTEEPPEGVKNLGAEQAVPMKKKREWDTPPVYTKWWFWATSVAVTAAVVFLAITPLTRQGRGCTTKGPGVIPLNCFGDGR